MKLTNFLFDRNLNGLRREMDAPLVEWFGASNWKGFNAIEFMENLRDAGVDTKFSELDTDSNGRFSLFGKRVLVYIRDQKMHSASYRYHVVNCGQLKSFQNAGLYDKYVASIRTDGLFLVNKKGVSGELIRVEEEELKICQRCLSQLYGDRFSRLTKREKERIRDNFDLQGFLAEDEKTNVVKPRYSSGTAPLNDYADNHKAIREIAIRENEFSCSECGIVLEDHPNYLHLHHVNQLKGYEHNSPSNLKVLCIACHAEQPRHGFMKSLPDYKEFRSLFHDDTHPDSSSSQLSFDL